MLRSKKGQVVIFALAKTFIFVILGIFLLNIYPAFKDITFSATESLWIRLPVLAMPFFYFIGIAFFFVRTIRQGAV